MGNSSPQSPVIPRHVAIIMDGNGRWAQQRNMPRTYGHKKGVEATRKAISFYARAGVSNLTLFAFSSENWKRPKEEVSTLMSLFLSSLQKNTDELNENGIRIRFIGERSVFAEKLLEQIEAAELKTRDNQQMTLNVAVNYGGRWDIVQAAQKLAAQVQRGIIETDDIDSEKLAAQLSLADIPDPDLFIRTGGEKRLSNFLLWQLAYSELFFSDVLWPDYSEKIMQQSLDEFAVRQRRFGRTAEQLTTQHVG